MKQVPVLAALLILSGIARNATAADLSLTGFVSGDGIASSAPKSWLDGGFGRLPAGTDARDGNGYAGTADLQLAMDWKVADHLSLYVHGAARAESDTKGTAPAGIVEAYAESVFATASSDRVRIRAGTMIVPSSRENVDELWTSPYMISFSAINSWIAEEVRPTGLDIDYRHELASGTRASLAATVFGGNDSSGALIGWRGWSLGDRLTTAGERLPLPPLQSLESSFTSQMDGTRPVEGDLDGRAGWSARVRIDRRGLALLQVMRYDNRGDRELYHGEYSWATTFDLVSFELTPAPYLTILAEHLQGSTGMGRYDGPHVDADMRSTYLLASVGTGRLRVTGRYDRFETSSADFATGADNGERGDAYSVAFVFTPTESWRIAAEVMQVDATRPSNAVSGGDPDNGGNALLLQVRRTFRR